MKSSNWLRCVSFLLAGTLLSFGDAAVAQLQSQMDPRYMPQGSPLSPSGSSEPSMQQQQAGSNTAGSLVQPSAGIPSLHPDVIVDADRETIAVDRLLQAQRDQIQRELIAKAPPKPGEFERYVERVIGRKLPRFGSDLLLPEARDFAAPATATVPADYILNPGDVVAIAMAGSFEGSVEREIDSNGNIFLPKVGVIHVAGIRNADLHERISAAIGRQYRGYTVSARVKELRGIRVYVTGFANHPGAFTVSSLSTMANAAFAAGGPNEGGSFRTMKLYRGGQEVADLDLYQLLRGGNRANDAVLQNEDVLFIPPAGPQVAVIGSVHQEAIYEAKPGEPLENMLAAAGGPNDLGDGGRVIVYRTSRPDQIGPQQVTRQQLSVAAIAPGDILQVLSQGSLVQPVDRQSVLVRVEGEVNRPGNYYVAPNTPLSVVMQMAGGLTSRSFAFGTRLTRQSVRTQQRESYQEAIKQLELTLAAAPLTADKSQAAADRDSQLNGARQVLDRLREAEPDGRVVMQIGPDWTSLPGDILLENNDSIYVPPRSTTVGVFGAVYRPASFMLDKGQRPLR
ncbi:MAG TPA: SLBB domain-containing protein, partial [Bryobacteraceae bacterium]